MWNTTLYKRNVKNKLSVLFKYLVMFLLQQDFLIFSNWRNKVEWKSTRLQPAGTSCRCGRFHTSCLGVTVTSSASAAGQTKHLYLDPQLLLLLLLMMMKPLRKLLSSWPSHQLLLRLLLCKADKNNLSVYNSDLFIYSFVPFLYLFN